MSIKNKIPVRISLTGIEMRALQQIAEAVGLTPTQFVRACTIKALNVFLKETETTTTSTSEEAK